MSFGSARAQQSTHASDGETMLLSSPTKTALAPPTVPLTEEQQAAELRVEIESLQAKVTQARAEADTTVETARAQAARLVDTAQKHAHQLRTDAAGAQYAAEQLHTRATALARIHVLRGVVADADRQAETLSAESKALTEQADGLTARLDELGVDREDTGAQLAAAREAGNVDRVGELRHRLASIDEVAAVLGGQRQVALGRRTAIGDDNGAGELAHARQQTAQAHAEIRELLNTLDPDRPEARRDRLQRRFEMVAEGLAKDMAPPPVRHVEQVLLPTAIPGKASVLPAVPGGRGPIVVQPLRGY